MRAESRGYRAHLSLSDYTTKILKPQNIVEMLHGGSRDLGFAGADWVAELNADVVELLDTGLDPVQVVVAGPIGNRNLLQSTRPLVVASEYESLTQRWIAEAGLRARFVRSFGATEVFPPDDADFIVDNTSTGSTLRANGLEIIGTVLESTTRLYASPRALENSELRQRIDNLVMLLDSVLQARERVMVELNIQRESLDRVVQVLPSMRGATVADLVGANGYAVKAAVRRDCLSTLLPELKARGGTDLVVSELRQVLP